MPARLVLHRSAISLSMAFATFGVTTAVARASCSSVSACVFGQDTGTGIGVEGTAVANDGVYGATTFATTSASSAKAGVFGRDLTSKAAAKYDYGVLGQSTYGFGVGGSSVKNVGVTGISSSDYGVQGISSASNGVVGKTKFNSTLAETASGVVGYDQSTNNTTYNNGVLGFSSRGVGVRGTTDEGTGVSGSSYDGPGVSASSILGDALVATTNVGYNYGTAAAVHAFALRNSFAPHPNVFVGSADDTGSMNDVVSIDNYGNMILAGTLTQDGTPLVRTAVTRGAAVVSFGARTSAPTIEDMGEAKLVDGHAFVRLDAAYANTIDTAAPYLVFVTPRSESKGLYVDRVGPTGFDVRENAAGRSSLTFDYRIAAKPHDSATMRLPAAAALAHLGPTRNVPHSVRVRAAGTR